MLDGCLLPFSGVSRLRFPPGPHLRSSRFSRHPRLRRLRPGGLRKNRNLRGLVVFVGKRPQAPGGPGPKPWGPGPQAPSTLTDFLQAKFLTSCCVSNPWVRVSKRYHNPQSADLGGRWMVSEGGAVQFHERRGFPSSLQHFSRWAGPQAPGDLANKPLCIPVKNSKNAPVLIGS